MKWIGRILYIIVVVIIGTLVLRFSQINAQVKYYNDNALPYLIENDRENYIEGYMTANLVEEYLKYPIYLANSNDETFTFEFAIYHLRVTNNDNNISYLTFYFNEVTFNYEELLSDYNSYEENNNTAGILIELKMAGVDEIVTNYYPLDINFRMPIVILEQVKVNNDELFRFQVVDSNDKEVNKTSNEIEKITITLEDLTTATTEQPDPIKTVIAEFNSDSTNDLSLTDNLILNGDTLESNNFNGAVSNYALNDNYSNESLLGATHFGDLSVYQKGVVKSLIIYFLIVVVITFLLFFLKPLMNHLNQRRTNKETKELKALSNNNELEEVEVIEKPIFEDKD